MFELHDRLAADTIDVTRWPLCRVLLMNDSTYPWLILVPQRPGLREMHHLPAADRHRLMEEIATASAALEVAFTPDKLNVAALGNLVPQLHVHVIARYRTDPAWPGPVWGAAPPQPYAAGDRTAVLSRLRQALAAE